MGTTAKKKGIDVTTWAIIGMLAAIGVIICVLVVSLTKTSQALADQRRLTVAQGMVAVDYRTLADKQGEVIIRKNRMLDTRASTIRRLKKALKEERAAKAKAQKAAKKAAAGSPASGGWVTTIATGYGKGDGLIGQRTASGIRLDTTTMIVAHPSLPLHSVVQVSYGGRTVTAKVLDRGPAAWTGHGIDLGPAVARALHFHGHAQVKYRLVKRG
jgi:rare lipoprotein A (peptidoglycan hydrolase)